MFNINAEPFIPKGKILIETTRLFEDDWYDRMENVWWNNNAGMFEDSLKYEISQNRYENPLQHESI